MLRCSTCRLDKPVTDFYRQRGASRGYQAYCKECQHKARKTWAGNNRDKERIYNRKSSRRRLYGVEREDFYIMMDRQLDLCGVCRIPLDELERDPCVDHCHECKANRGLLCHSCNSGIGFFQDSPEIIRNAVAYLEFHENNPGQTFSLLERDSE